MVPPKTSDTALDDGAASRLNIPEVIDPTKNVEALVKSLEDKLTEFRITDNRFLDAQLANFKEFSTFARDSNFKFTTFAREAGDQLQNSLRIAETVRVNELAATRKEYENTIRDMLAKSVETTSTLVSTQLVQIQATFDKRVSQLEAYQFTQAGRSSVADPALANALTQLAEGQKITRSNMEEAFSKMTNALLSVKETQIASGSTDTSKVDQAAIHRANAGLYISIGLALIVLYNFARATGHAP